MYYLLGFPPPTHTHTHTQHNSLESHLRLLHIPIVCSFLLLRSIIWCRGVSSVNGQLGCYVFLMYCWIPCERVIFASSLMRHTSRQFSLFCNVFIWFWYQGHAGFVKRIESLPFFWIFWKGLCRIVIIPPLNVW